MCLPQSRCLKLLLPFESTQNHTFDHTCHIYFKKKKTVLKDILVIDSYHGVKDNNFSVVKV